MQKNNLKFEKLLVWNRNKK